ncbi:MAG TPA: dTDP-4-dehydrorhamnose 3,5-epimerase [Steroidobacteraceae bacterium]|nr:dTDP-4-dehydrorhamnose 3,5-epimerase [Steroidobacteraceae bacterium]
MLFTATPLDGVFVIDLKKITDERGFFARGWCRDTLAANGLNPNQTQLNVGFSHRRGTLRGLHFQKAPHAEVKIVRCTRGAVFDVAVDLREDSATRGQWFGVELSADNHKQLYVPEGFAHGYQTLEEDSEIEYSTTHVYAAASAGGVRYDDPAFGIRWPLPVSVISDADRKWASFK